MHESAVYTCYFEYLMQHAMRSFCNTRRKNNTFHQNSWIVKHNIIPLKIKINHVLLMLSENYYLAYDTLNDYSNCLKGFAKDDS